MRNILISFFLVFYCFSAVYAQDSTDWVVSQNTILLKKTFSKPKSQKEFQILRDSLLIVSPKETVILSKDTLLIFRCSAGGMGIRERKETLNKNLSEIATKGFQENLFEIYENRIFYDKKLVLEVTEDDALWENQTQADLAKLWLKKMTFSLRDYQSEYGLKYALFRILRLALVIGILLLFLWFINYSINYLQVKFLSGQFQIAKNIRISNSALLGKTAVRVLKYFANIFQFLLTVATFFFIIPTIFSFFPNTKPLADQIISYIETPFRRMIDGFLNYLPNFFTILVVYVVTRFFIRLMRFIAEAVEDEHVTIKGFYSEWAMPTFTIFKVVVYLFMIVAIFPYLPGSESPFFRGISVFVGILISFGSGSAVSNLVAGVILTYMRPFRVGDLVKIGEIEGWILEKNFLLIRIKSIKNEEITIPNSNVLTFSTVNFSASKNYIVRSKVSIGYHTDWRLVHHLLIEAAKMTPSVVENPPPYVLQKALGDFYIEYEINAVTDNSLPFFEVTSKLNENISTVFHYAGVDITSPHFFHISE